jgi:hypothetical protein
MQFTGHRRCKQCASEWSYFETGSVSCPECGAIKSTGIGGPEPHTAQHTSLELAPYWEVTDEEVRIESDKIRRAVTEFLSEYGFIKGGDFLPLHDEVLAAGELRHAAYRYNTLGDPSEEVEHYLLGLLRAVMGESRPTSPPDVLKQARGRGTADILEQFLRDMRQWTQARAATELMPIRESFRTHLHRIQALEGDVDPVVLSRLIQSARAVQQYIAREDQQSLSKARDHLADVT